MPLSPFLLEFLYPQMRRIHLAPQHLNLLHVRLNRLVERPGQRIRCARNVVHHGRRMHRRFRRRRDTIRSRRRVLQRLTGRSHAPIATIHAIWLLLLLLLLMLRKHVLRVVVPVRVLRVLVQRRDGGRLVI